ncbi:citrate lyase subunit alpha, partial [Listeria monocytogenes]|nr:citrate lyase subunit alpha [Listeria monocytogenes]
MVLNKAGKDIPECYANQYGVFENETANIHAYKEASRKIEPVLPGKSKVLGSIREAIEKTGLTDGMTISFHHHFREGDFIMNLVLDEIAKMGIKNLAIAPSSIANVHEPLIGHIKSGVVTNITSSGLRDKV